MYLLLIVSLLIATLVLALPWQPWSTRESLDADNDSAAADLSEVTVLIPARNEAHLIGLTLAGVASQGTGFKVVVIDDESSDNTAAIARASAVANLEVIAAAPLPADWSGKLWALEQGRKRVQTPLILLLDADIVLARGTLSALCRKLATEDLQLVSLMAHLGMASFWERLLLPAFVYFFKLIYPFRLANDPRSRVAAAAGGCILLNTAILDAVGGFAAVKNALIDDCALAAIIKRAGGKTWLGLTHSARSLRRYTLADVWKMVARTAYTQLRYSPWLLALCTALLLLYCELPAAILVGGSGSLRPLALGAYALLALPYVPTLSYYRLSACWALLLPITAALFLAMTWTSAIRYYHGERSRWKGRSYQREA